MRKTELPLPEIGVIAATRVMLGAGVGMLVAPRLTPAQRRTTGWALLGIGVVSTIPLVLDVFRRSRRTSADLGRT